MRTHLEGRLHALDVPAGVVDFAGSLPPEAMHDEYARAAICVIPSRWENFPYSCLEAMSAGCAVVAADTGGLKEIITDQHDGLLAPPNDAAAISSRIVTLLDRPDHGRALGDAARRTVHERFSRSRVCAQLMDIYTEATTS
jgi:glycosyltransferase involved in cell wall biosynthesis